MLVVVVVAEWFKGGKRNSKFEIITESGWEKKRSVFPAERPP